MLANPLPIVWSVLKGLLSWVPGVPTAFYDRTAGGATQSAEYCYGVWLKHLALLWKHGMREIPSTVIELGPGNSLGTGFAALLCGAERYVAIDTVRHARATTNRKVLEALIVLFHARAGRPTKGWPDFDDCLDERLFPSKLLTGERLEQTLAPQRLRRLRSPAAPVSYATWREGVRVGHGEADLVFSHVALNLVDDLDGVFAHCARWLKPGGWTSHQIDLTSMRTTAQWNGHLRFGERTWSVISGRRPFFVSRARASAYREALRRQGLEVVAALYGMRRDGLPRLQHAPRFQGMRESDLGCGEMFLIARKPVLQA